MIELKSIVKNFNGTNALKDFNLSVPEFSTTVLIGPSGCGKSTVLRLITGLEKSDKGDVLIDNEIVDKNNLSAFRRRIGYVIQSGGLFPHVSSFENVVITARYFKWSKSKIADRIEELCQLTGFPPDALNRFPGQLSGGQKQRVSLMRSLMLDPDILLFDEPLGSLDPLIRFDLQRDLKNIFKTLNKTVLMVTHDLNEAAYFADIIVLMKSGQVVQRGDLNSLINNPKNNFVIDFITAQRTLI